jgi:predicted hotdog family 3-hydroxylacyl-ACP dehydratase
MLDRAWIAAHIPHQGSMCLLDRVAEWSPERIRCTSGSHRRLDNPLRADGRLGSVCGIEYAAQAMAVHGVLATATATAGPPRQGYLTSMRGVDLFADRLDDIDADLDIEAERLSGDDNTVLYRFEVRAAGRLLLGGRAAVILDAAARKENRS